MPLWIEYVEEGASDYLNSYLFRTGFEGTLRTDLRRLRNKYLGGFRLRTRRMGKTKARSAV